MTLSSDFKSRVDRKTKEMSDEQILLMINCSSKIANERPDLFTVAYALVHFVEEAEKRGLLK